MLSKWSVHDFKSIETAEVDLNGLNIVVGENSIGKSSLLHSIVALAQIEDEDHDEEVVFTSGSTIDLGLPGSVIRRAGVNSSVRGVEFSYELTKSAGIKANQLISGRVVKNATYKFGIDGRGEALREHLKSTTFRVGGADFIFSRTFSIEKGKEVSTSTLSWVWAPRIVATIARQKMVRPNQPSASVRNAGKSREWQEKEIEVATWFIELEKGLVLDTDSGQPGSSEEPAFDLGNLMPRALAFFKREYLGGNVVPGAEKIRPADVTRRSHWSWTDDQAQAIVEKLKQEPVFVSDGTLQKTVLDFAPFPASQKRFLPELSHSVLYLGPLRALDPRQQSHKASSSGISPLGTSAENTAFWLRKHGGEISTFPMPSGEIQEMELNAALDIWMRHLGLTRKIKVTSSEAVGLKLTYNNLFLNQVGSGVSQLLPVVILCLMTRTREFSDKLVLIEHPELHLHPSVQAKLADLFAIFSSHGTNFLLETHSEYIITRLRLLAATSQVKDLNLSLIFAEKVNDSGRSPTRFSQSKMDELGRLNYWPKGFMGSILDDRMQLAAIQILNADD